MVTGDFKSIFYTQKRIGKNGKFIYIYKFRSMVPNADEVLKELLKEPKYKKEWDKNQKLEHDPRITKIGKIIRKTSLDEVPQFINVLKGEHLDNLNEDDILYFKTKEIYIECEDGLTTDIDGEKGPDFPLDIKCIKGGLKILGVK